MKHKITRTRNTQYSLFCIPFPQVWPLHLESGVQHTSIKRPQWFDRCCKRLTYQAIPNPNLGLTMFQHEFILAVKMWFSIPIFRTSSHVFNLTHLTSSSCLHFCPKSCSCRGGSDCVKASSISYRCYAPGIAKTIGKPNSDGLLWYQNIQGTIHYSSILQWYESENLWVICYYSWVRISISNYYER